MVEQKKSRQIVSRWQYAKTQAHRFVMALFGGLFGLLSLLGFLLAILLLLYWIFNFNIVSNSIILIASVFMATLAFILYCKSTTLLTSARLRDPGILITRANTADLPAEELLVRASTEPTEQQAVLLRATSESNTTPMEQLVKPVGE